MTDMATEDYELETVEREFYHLLQILQDRTEDEWQVFSRDDSFFYTNTYDVRIPIEVEYAGEVVDVMLRTHDVEEWQLCDAVTLPESLKNLLTCILDFIHILPCGTDYFICHPWTTSQSDGKDYCFIQIVVYGDRILEKTGQHRTVAESPQFHALLRDSKDHNADLFDFTEVVSSEAFREMLNGLMYRCTWIDQDQYHLWPFYGWSG